MLFYDVALKSEVLPQPVCLAPFSRAVQRSLAIIRQAKQKKEKKKEYCMYYNRFGRCNRGENCPYIHDPEKVAVCTRYGWNLSASKCFEPSLGQQMTSELAYLGKNPDNGDVRT